jgi:hypothetical protein
MVKALGMEFNVQRLPIMRCSYINIDPLKTEAILSLPSSQQSGSSPYRQIEIISSILELQQR